MQDTDTVRRVTMIVESLPEVDSLSTGQVQLLLRTLAAHKSYLDSAHQDAAMLSQKRLRPAYLLDFDLLYRYMFEYVDHVDWAQEFQFLIGQAATDYIIGPGTQTELVRLKESSHDRRAGRLDAREIARRLPELARLLRAPNVIAYEDLVGSMQVDEEAYHVAKVTLDRSRRLHREDANQADALNWAAVVYIRKRLADLGNGAFPYLLTSTDPLLREEAWDPDFAVPISRDPGAAIYSHVLFETYTDPEAAMRHTVQAAFDIARVERDLRSSAAYLHPREHESEPDWEQAVAHGRIGSKLRQQLNSLGTLVDDRVIYMTQRIYDNADLVAANVASQTRTLRPSRSHESPRRLFDLIASLNAAVHIPPGDERGLASLWRTVLTLVTVESGSFTVYELRDSASRLDKPPYLALEIHHHRTSARLHVMRWPCGIDAEAILAATQGAFARHGIDRIRLTVGTASDAERFDAMFPLTVHEIVAACDTVGRSRSPGDVDTPAIRWLRMDSEPFDIYADIAAEMPHDPVIGVFASSINMAHVAELYHQSSARYLFPAWLRAALEHLASLAPPSSNDPPRVQG